LRRDDIASITDAVVATKLGEGDFTTAYFDAKSGSVRISTSGDGSAYKSLVAAFPTAVQLNTNASGGRTSRNNDAEPHKGGAVNMPCTSGYAVKLNGILRMVSAAHCQINGVGSSVVGGTGQNWGIVTNWGPYPAWDVMLISGNHQGKIYSGDFTGVLQSVKGAGDPMIGPTSYCSSGKTSTEHCGHHAVALNGILCDVDGCTTQLAVFHDGVPIEPGDSGGPWYNYASGGGVTIRGSTVGMDESNGDMFAERWLQTKAHWNLTIATS
jgi:hypothetical protein